jgi:hypothetical protein
MGVLGLNSLLTRTADRVRIVEADDVGYGTAMFVVSF